MIKIEQPFNKQHMRFTFYLSLHGKSKKKLIIIMKTVGSF